MNTNVNALRQFEFEEMVKLYEASLLAFLDSLTRCRDDSQDILQNVFLRIYEMSRIEDTELVACKPLLYRMARSMFIDFYRKESREKIVSEKTARLESDGERVDSSPKIIAILHVALDDPDLSVRQGVCLRLFLLGELKLREIATFQEVSFQTVHRDIKSGFRVLQKYYQDEGLYPMAG